MVILCIISIFFILFPLFLNFKALFKSMKEWMTDSYHGDRYRNYLTHYDKILFFMSIISGSTFATIALLNSNLFGWRIFSMGLSNNELLKFNQKRLINVIICENIPQLLIQSIFMFITQEYTLVIFFAMSSSTISIAMAVWSFLTQRQYIKISKGRTENKVARVFYTIKVTSNYIKQGTNYRKKFFHKRYYVTKRLSELFGVDSYSVEVLPYGKFNDIKRGHGLILSFLIITTSKTENELFDIMNKSLQVDISKISNARERKQGNNHFARLIYLAWTHNSRTTGQNIGPIEVFDFKWINRNNDTAEGTEGIEGNLNSTNSTNSTNIAGVERIKSGTHDTYDQNNIGTLRAANEMYNSFGGKTVHIQTSLQPAFSTTVSIAGVSSVNSINGLHVPSMTLNQVSSSNDTDNTDNSDKDDNGGNNYGNDTKLMIEMEKMEKN